MRFLDRADEMRRLDALLAQPGAFAVLWGRRRVGKTRLLVEWSRRRDGLYAAVEPSAPAVQRRYLAAAVERRFPGFAAVEYPDWRSFLVRLAREAQANGWPGPFVLDELPYLIAADPTLPGVLQAWVDSTPGRPTLVASGSSRRMMHGAALAADAPLYGRARETFAVRPFRPGHLADVFPRAAPRDLLALYAAWGGMPRYWELAEPFGTDVENAIDALVLDPSGPLHGEPDRLLLEEVPPATALRPLLDVIGGGAHRVSEIARRLGRPASTLARPLAALVEMGLVRRETPFGSDPRAGKRSLYRIDDPSCACGSASSRRRGRPLWRPRAKRAWGTGTATAPRSKRRRGKSSAAWPSPSCTAPTPLSADSAPGSQRNAGGGATSRSTTSWRARSTAAACLSARRRRRHDRWRRPSRGSPQARPRCRAPPVSRSCRPCSRRWAPLRGPAKVPCR